MMSGVAGMTRTSACIMTSGCQDLNAEGEVNRCWLVYAILHRLVAARSGTSSKHQGQGVVQFTSCNILRTF
eukprot:2085756-Pleurochrysis_carterae.AAC.4